MLRGRKRLEALWRRLRPRHRRIQNRQSCDREQGPGQAGADGVGHLTIGGYSNRKCKHLQLYLFSVAQVSLCCWAVKGQAVFSPRCSDSTCLLRSPAGDPQCPHLHYELQRAEECPVHSLSPHRLLRGKNTTHHRRHLGFNFDALICFYNITLSQNSEN